MVQMAADKVKEDVELDEMEDEEEVGEKGANSKRSLPGSINAYQNFLEMMQVTFERLFSSTCLFTIYSLFRHCLRR